MFDAGRRSRRSRCPTLAGPAAPVARASRSRPPGPRGTQTQVRIRGAEANHTLLFVDGIRFNDPAAGNEARFELLTSDSLSRRRGRARAAIGALWGSEALGGVIAAETRRSLAAAAASRALAEYGSLDSARLSGRYAVQAGDVGVMASAGWLRSDGIDFVRRAAASATASTIARASLKVGGAAVRRRQPRRRRPLDPGQRANMTASTRSPSCAPTRSTRPRNRIGAVRGWARGRAGAAGRSRPTSQLSRQRQPQPARRRAAQPHVRRPARRSSAQLSRQLRRPAADRRRRASVRGLPRPRHRAIFGGTDQDRSRAPDRRRRRMARANGARRSVTDLAVRHDRFSAFADATTFRASAAGRGRSAGSRLHAAYGEGIAQPTFYDLYGFFPGSFVGNPALKPERSRGWEAGAAAGRMRRVQPRNHRLRGTAAATRSSTTSIPPPSSPAPPMRAGEAAGARASSSSADWRPSAGPERSPSINLARRRASSRSPATARVREVRRPAAHGFNLDRLRRSGRLRWGVEPRLCRERGRTRISTSSPRRR